uniref:autotransporter assembly complex protein TamA n=1 Tax=Amaricoccus sp. TaxID=1872485 RepID=UPI00260A9E56
DPFEVIDPLHYTATLDVAGGDEALRRRLENASALWNDRERPVSGNGGLLSKARGDYRRLLAALYAAGYYGPEISIRADGREVADLTLAVDFPENVPIAIRVVPGPEFRFGRADIVNRPPLEVDESDEADGETPESIGFATGEPAYSGVIDQVSAVSIERWRQLSRAKARETGREVIADHASDRLDVTLTLDPGRPARYGPISVAGRTRVDPGFIRYMADLEEGDDFDPDEIQAAQNRLMRLGVFRSLRFVEADEIEPDGSLPIAIAVEDRRPRTIGFGATLSTIDGLGVTAFWQHRNLLGRAEQLRFDAGINGLGGSLDPEEYDYNLGVTFTKPGVFNPDTSFITSLIGQRVNYDTYRERSVTASAGFSRQFGARLTGSAFVEASRARYDDDFGIRHFTTLGIVGKGAYDERDDPLDAHRGFYLAVEAQPFHEFVYGNFATRGTLEGRVYRSFGQEDHLVLAGRAKAGTYVGADVAESPPDLLFFAGGGGSVRGYAYQSIGVETVDADGETQTSGGKGLFEASAEVRYRINDSFGAVGFVDSGFVTENSDLSGESDLRTGVGVGVRYYTGIGILRADLATPVDPRDDDSTVALYIGIGQAF